MAPSFIIDEEELLHYAKKHYPVGTVINNSRVINMNMHDATVISDDFWSDGIIVQVVCNNTTGESYHTIYKGGIWAERVKDNSLEQARKIIYQD